MLNVVYVFFNHYSQSFKDFLKEKVVFFCFMYNSMGVHLFSHVVNVVYPQLKKRERKHNSVNNKR